MYLCRETPVVSHYTQKLNYSQGNAARRKATQSLVYASIAHLHFKSSMLATSEILLFPSSNSGLPLRKAAGKEVEEEKTQTGLTRGHLGKVWVAEPTSVPAPDDAESVLFHHVQDIDWTLYSTPSQLLKDVPKVFWTAWRTQPPPHTSLRNTGSPTHPSVRPSTPAADQVPFRKHNISNEENVLSFAFLSVKYNAWRRATPDSLLAWGEPSHSMLLRSRSAGATSTFTYYNVPVPSRETPTSFLRGSA